MLALIVGLATVAVPLCSTGACDMAAGTMRHGMDEMGDGMAGMTHAMAPVYQAACDMVTMVTGTVEKAVPPTSTTLPIGLVAALALAMLTLMPRLTPARLTALVGDPPAPPGDLRGVCLLN